MKVGLVGKPNAGKSTFFSAATQAPAAADYSAFLNESLQLYSYAESQGRKTT